MTPNELKFCRLYVNCGQDDAKGAYEEAFKRVKDSKNLAAQLLRKKAIKTKIAELVAEQVEDTPKLAERVINEWAKIAFADPRELVQYVACNCRYCWGDEFQHQYTHGEWITAVAAAMDAAVKAGQAEYEPPPELGGVGFDAYRAPHPDCPHCLGRGQRRVLLATSDKLSEEAQALLAGFEHTAHGVRVNMHSKPEALKELTRILGLTPDVVRVLFPQFAPSGNTNAPTGLAEVNAADAAMLYMEFVQGIKL